MNRCTQQFHNSLSKNFNSVTAENQPQESETDTDPVRSPALGGTDGEVISDFFINAREKQRLKKNFHGRSRSLAALNVHRGVKKME